MTSALRTLLAFVFALAFGAASIACACPSAVDIPVAEHGGGQHAASHVEMDASGHAAHGVGDEECAHCLQSAASAADDQVSLTAIGSAFAPILAQTGAEALSQRVASLTGAPRPPPAHGPPDRSPVMLRDRLHI